MKLPENSIGATDLLAHRDCPRRFSYGMKRHTGLGLQSDDETPEAGSYATDYGSCVHEVLRHVEDGYSDEDAIQKAWNEWGHRLEPSDVELLRDDIKTYRTRDFPHTRVLSNEDEFRVPLFTHPEHGQIFFRFKLDRLYERVDAPGTFVHVDYKSSRWARSEREVHADLQLWMYNWAIHEYWPECRSLLQAYDQLRYGQIPTRKSDKQRAQIRDWIVKATTAVIDDTEFRGDGLLKPRKNQWCAWCPVMESCSIVPDLTDFALVELDALAPARREGRKTIVDVDENRIRDYVERFGDVRIAMQVLERFNDSVRRVLRDMPAEDRLELGYDLKGRRKTTFSAQALRELHERLGDEFYDLAGVTQTRLKSYLEDDPELLEWALSLGTETAGPEVLLPR
jgi:hypothetical protein